MMRERIAVTGLGVICAAGQDRKAFFSRLVSGVTALRLNRRPDVGPPGHAFVGEVEDQWLEEKLGSGEAARYGRDVQLALVAGREALEHAGLPESGPRRERVGLVLGKCQGTTLADGQPTWIHATADLLAGALDLGGPRQTVSTACAAGGNAIGIGMDRLFADDADVILAGGVDTLQQTTFIGFSSLHAVDSQPCSPYSRSGGLNLGEGAAFLVLETFGHAEARGAQILAEVMGYGLSADAYHASAPDPSGSGAVLAVRRALDDAGIEEPAVTYVNGHGTGTKSNDNAERRVMRLLFGQRVTEVPITGTKSFTGHTLGAAGAVEAVASVLSITEGVIPPTVNFAAPAGTASDLDFVPGTPRQSSVDVVVSNNYAFGGNNASVIFGARRRQPVRRSDPARRAVITGMSLLGRCGIGLDEWLSALGGQQPPSGAADDGDLIRRLAKERFAAPTAWRQMNAFTRMCTAAVRLAVDDAKLPMTREERRSIGLFLGTMSGPGIRFDPDESNASGRGNVRFFTQATLNAPAGAVCQAFGFRGPTTTIVSGETSGTLALEGALDAIRLGRADVMIVVAAEESSETQRDIYRFIGSTGSRDRACPYATGSEGTSCGTAAVAIVLEAATVARQRGARLYAQVTGIAHTADNFHPYRPDPTGARYADAVRIALERSATPSAAIGLASVSADGTDLDLAEAAAMSRILAPGTPVVAPAAATGGCHAASGLINIAYPLLASSGRPAPGPMFTVGELTWPCTWKPLPHADKFLATSASFGGTYGAAVLEREPS